MSKTTKYKKIVDLLEQYSIDKISIQTAQEYSTFSQSFGSILGHRKTAAGTSSVEATVLRINDPIFQQELEKKKMRVKLIDMALNCLDKPSFQIISELYLIPPSKRKSREEIAEQLDISLQCLFQRRRKALELLTGILNNLGLE